MRGEDLHRWLGVVGFLVLLLFLQACGLSPDVELRAVFLLGKPIACGN